jgi:hypothetical protein
MKFFAAIISVELASSMKLWLDRADIEFNGTAQQLKDEIARSINETSEFGFVSVHGLYFRRRSVDAILVEEKIEKLPVGFK